MTVVGIICDNSTNENPNYSIITQFNKENTSVDAGTIVWVLNTSH
jgi:hypothetical protein